MGNKGTLPYKEQKENACQPFKTADQADQSEKNRRRLKCMRQARRACTDAGNQTNRNLTVDAAASAAPKVASRYLIQDDSAGAGAGVAAARSSSLTSFGSTVATPAVKAGAGPRSAAATGVEVPALAGAGGQAATAGAGLSFRSASAA